MFREARVPDMVKAVLDGYHATTFAYGQTGSGKTHCMEGFKYKQVQASACHSCAVTNVDVARASFILIDARRTRSCSRVTEATSASCLLLQVSKAAGKVFEPRAVFDDTDPKRLGLIPRAVQLLFRTISRSGRPMHPKP
jgi:hypothetical protein